MAEISSKVSQAVEVLNSHELIGFPTETVYGLAGNALNDNTVLKIYEVKNRPKFDPLILHFSSIEKILNYVDHIPLQLEILLRQFSPGPITLLLKKSDKVSDLVNAGLDRVAVRIPSHPLAMAVLEKVSYPLAAPSANPFGYVSPTSPAHVQAQLGDQIPFILDGGTCEVGVESTIVGMEGNKIVIYRKGGITVEQIEALLGEEVVIKDTSSSSPAAPGMLLTHYAPAKNNYILERASLKINELDIEKTGCIVFSEIVKGIPLKNQVILSKTGDLAESAKNLFAGFRKLDELDIDSIYMELLPEVGLGRAINDKIRRAASK